jgi:hypothetical protein
MGGQQQPWTFIVVCDKDVLDRLSHAAKSHMLATCCRPAEILPTHAQR